MLNLSAIGTINNLDLDFDLTLRSQSWSAAACTAAYRLAYTLSHSAQKLGINSGTTCLEAVTAPHIYTMYVRTIYMITHEPRDTVRKHTGLQLRRDTTYVSRIGIRTELCEIHWISWFEVRTAIADGAFWMIGTNSIFLLGAYVVSIFTTSNGTECVHYGIQVFFSRRRSIIWWMGKWSDPNVQQIRVISAKNRRMGSATGPV